MEWNIVLEMIAPELLGVLVACWIVGFTLKKTPRVPNWSIVYIVTALAIVAAGFVLGWSVLSVIQGILVGAFAVFGHQFVKQVKVAANDSN
ncbi:hypothetical protein EBB07_00695 [Paenibacillaceae bacterium]|nr:hypothetical protein EBB07_33710 [Paenibacillaceae bacterium]RXZ84568.1 hypothetical protein EBB07_00695 [Paenibacillaceae bacterium]